MGAAPQSRQPIRDREVDTGPFPAARPYPSMSEVWDASRSLQGLDNSDAHAQRIDRAYDPVIAAINRVRAREGKPLLMSPSLGQVVADALPERGSYATGIAQQQGEDAATAQVMSEIARIKRAYPGALKGVPDTREAILAPQIAADIARRDRARDVLDRSSGLVQGATAFAGTVEKSLEDPVNLATLPFGGGGKTLLGIAAREALANGLSEVVQLPGVAANRAELGEQLTFAEGAQMVAEAAVGGAVIGGGLHLGGKLADNLYARLPERFKWQPADLAKMPDSELSAAAKADIGTDRMTPDERAAVHVVDRQADVDAVSPYRPDAAGADAHATALDGAIAKVAATPEAIANAAAVPRETSAAVPRPVEAINAPGLTQDGIIRFVIRELEGGGRVVDNGDGAGTTKYGITAKYNPGVDVANLTEDQAAAIARRRYWLPEFNSADPRVAAVAFDANYLRSPALARRILREATNDPARAIEIYRADLMALIDRDPSKAKFRKGWNNRLDRLKAHVDANPVARLDPARFGGDTELYRAQQAAIDAEALALHQETPAKADPVGDFVDALVAGDERARAELGGDDFAVANAQAIEGEIARRAALGTDEPIAARAGDVPRETSPDVPRPTTTPVVPASDPADRAALAARVDTLLAVKAYAANRANSLRLDRIAAKLGISEGEAAHALETLAGAENSTIQKTKGRMVPKRGADGKFIYTDRGSKRVRVTEYRPPRFIRKARYSQPDDVVRFLARHGGLRDDEGHDLAGMGFGLLSGGREGFLIRKDGMSLDRAREMLVEADFIMDAGARGDGLATSTEDDVLDLLGRAARGEKVYPLTVNPDDIRPQVDWDEERQMMRDYLIQQDPKLESLDTGLIDDMAELVAAYGYSVEDARIEIAQRELADALDAAYAENGDATYDWRPDPDQTPGGDQGHIVDWPAEGEPGYDAFVRYALEGIERDRALQGGDSAEGLGPPPLDPALHGIDDPVGPEAVALADDGLHDLRAEVDATEPNQPDIALGEKQDAQPPSGAVKDVSSVLDMGPKADPALPAKNRLKGQIAADGPPQLRGDQETTIGTPLFDAIDHGALTVDIDGRSMTAKEVLDEIDADQAAMESLKSIITGDDLHFQPRETQAQIKERLTAMREQSRNNALDRVLSEEAGAPQTVNRVSTIARLRKALIRDTGDNSSLFKYHIESLLKDLHEARAVRQYRVGDRQTGATYIRERLLRAQREGLISEEGVAFTEWFIRKNPSLLNDLGISIRASKAGEEGAAGAYGAAGRLMMLFKGSVADTTAVHEVLHHTERMMPQDMRDAIRGEWARRVADLAASSDERAQAFARAIIENDAAPSQQTRDMVTRLMRQRDDYHLVNPSEFWAVHATDILNRRYEAGSIWARLRTWMAEMVQHVRASLRLSSEAPVLRALDHLLRHGDGQISGKMLSQSKTLYQFGDKLDALVAKGAIDKDRAEAATKLFDELRQDFRRQFGDQAADKMATDATLRELQAQLTRKKILASGQAKAQQRILADADGYNGGRKRGGPNGGGPIDPRSGPAKIAGGDFRAKGDNVEGRRIAVRNRAYAMMDGALTRFSADLVGQVRNRAELGDVVRELFGEDTGNAMAKQIAKAWEATAEMLRRRFNAAGGDIGKLERWGLPQAHDTQKVRAAGFEAWRDFITPQLDRAAMVDRRTGLPFSDEALELVLRDVWETIRTDGWNGRNPGAVGQSMLANRRSDPRFLIFKDADSWMRYAEQFGAATPFDAMIGHINRMARDVAQIEILGPNPAATVKWLKDTLVKSAAIDTSPGTKAIEAAERAGKQIDRLMADITGQAGRPENRTIALGFSAVRSVQTAAKLGSASVTAIATDPAFGVVTRKFNGLPAVGIVEQYGRYLAATEDGAAWAIRMTGIAEEYAGRLASQHRALGEELTNETARRLAEGVLRVSGLSRVTEAGRWALGQTIVAHISHEASKGFDALDPAFRRLLERYNISARDWDAIRATPKVRDKGADWILPQYIKDETLGDRVYEMIAREADYAVPTPDINVRSFVNTYAPKGTWFGEAMRTGFLFKGFSIGMAMMQSRRLAEASSVGGWAAGRYAAGLFIATTLAGALALEMKDVLNGKDPRRVGASPLPTQDQLDAIARGEGPSATYDQKFWASAVAQGGGLGIFGDFAYGSTNRFGGGLASTIAGPTVQTAQGIVDVAGSKHPAWAAAKLLRQELPGGSIVGLRLAFDREVMDQIQQQIDPDYRKAWRRMEQRAAEQGSQYWWEPGQQAPERGPDFSNIAPQNDGETP